MTITTKLSEFIYDLKYENLPDQVVKKSKECILDTIGVTLAGTKFPDVIGITKEIKKYDFQSDCTIWGTDKKVSIFNAALINGTMAHAVEMDDVHKNSKSHAGAVVIPAALTLGEFHKINGKQFLVSVIAGYETMLRIGMGIGASSHRMKGWHATSTCGIFGSAAASAKILDLNPNKIISALGMAGTQSSGLWAFTEDGSSCKKFHAGKAAQGGILAAILALGGMTGPRSIIEANDGGLFNATSDEFDYSIVTKGLGSKYEILNIDRKPYACCRSMHPPINAVLELEKEYNLNPENIKKIEVHTYEIAIKQCGFTNQPKNVAEAKFCIPYGVAVALYDGNALIEQFSEDRIKDRKVLDLAKKVEVYTNEKFNKMYPENWGCKVKLITNDGNEYIKVILNAKGDTKNPLTEEEFLEKFKGLTKGILSEENQNRIIDCVCKIEEFGNIQDLVKFLSL